LFAKKRLQIASETARVVELAYIGVGGAAFFSGEIEGPVRITLYSTCSAFFSAGKVFFSHNNSARTVFFSQFQPKFCQPNRATGSDG